MATPGQSPPSPLQRATGRMFVTVVVPVGSVFGKEADEVVAPGVQGELGVLPGHIPFLTALRHGVLTVREGTTRNIFAVGPGFLEVGAGDTVKVLVSDALLGSEIDPAQAESDLASANQQLKGTLSEDAEGRAALEARRDWAQARLSAATAARVIH